MKSLAFSLVLLSSCTNAIALPSPSDGSVNSTASVQDVSAYYQAWSGDHCNGGEGGAIAINYPGGTDCVDAYGRHSFYVGNGPCKRFNLIFFENQGCGGRFVVSNYDPGCYNVNLGMAWGSTKAVCWGE